LPRLQQIEGELSTADFRTAQNEQEEVALRNPAVSPAPTNPETDKAANDVTRQSATERNMPRETPVKKN